MKKTRPPSFVTRKTLTINVSKQDGRRDGGRVFEKRRKPRVTTETKNVSDKALFFVLLDLAF